MIVNREAEIVFDLSAAQDHWKAILSQQNFFHRFEIVHAEVRGAVQIADMIKDHGIAFLFLQPRIDALRHDTAAVSDLSAGPFTHSVPEAVLHSPAYGIVPLHEDECALEIDVVDFAPDDAILVGDLIVEITHE